MSVNAYRVIKIERAKEPTFNCSFDVEVLDELFQRINVYDSRNDDGVGYIEVEVDPLEELVDLADREFVPGFTPPVIKAFRKDIAAVRRQRDTIITYDIY